MKTPPVNKIHPAFWLAIVLAIVTTSCATTNGNDSGSAVSSGSVKGATLLMQRP